MGRVHKLTFLRPQKELQCNEITFFAAPPIMKDEIRAAIRKMKLINATGPVSISVELLEALEDYGIDKISTLLNEIYETGQIPSHISKSIFIALP